MKVCFGCKQEKTHEEFRKDRTRGDGYKSRCKACMAIPSSTSRQVKEDPEEALRRVARLEATKQLVDNHLPEFRRLYQRKLDSLGVQARWRIVS